MLSFLLALAAGTHTKFVDTSKWMGAEYTPAAAPGNSLWWNWYDMYEPSVKRELAFAKKRLELTSIRVFLHSMVFSNNSSQLLDNMDRFLAIADSNNITVGFVFFGDCFNHTGTLTEQCVPVKGKHNGCWKSSPFDVERTNITRFEPYVTSVIHRFGKDQRVVWWEIFNEPSRRSTFSLKLRHAAYGWAKALNPIQPVLSCWDDSADTDVVDHHDYGTDFPGSWVHAIYSDVAKGAIVT